MINGRKISDRPFLPSVNPARPEQVVGYWAKGTIADAEAAVAASVAYFPEWRATPADERAGDARAGGRPHGGAPPRAQFAPDPRGRQAVDGGRRRRLGGDRLLPLLRQEMRRLGRPVVTQSVPGEAVLQTWTPRGRGRVGGAVELPLAILTGLTVAPLVAGNCVIIKPARQTSVIGAFLMEILTEAGVPAGRDPLSAVLRRGRRRPPRRPSQGRFHRLHRLPRGGLRDLGGAGRTRPGQPT